MPIPIPRPPKPPPPPRNPDGPGPLRPTGPLPPRRVDPAGARTLLVRIEDGRVLTRSRMFCCRTFTCRPPELRVLIDVRDGFECVPDGFDVTGGFDTTLSRGGYFGGLCPPSGGLTTTFGGLV